jgi:hypothetical protein
MDPGIAAISSMSSSFAPTFSIIFFVIDAIAALPPKLYSREESSILSIPTRSGDFVRNSALLSSLLGAPAFTRTDAMYNV